MRTVRIAALTVSGLIETGYEDATFLVLDSADDGWIEIRFAPEGQQSEVGTAWVPACALPGEKVDLRVETWQDRFLSDQISPLFFRSAGPHRLRKAPRDDSEKLGTIAGDYHLEPLEIAGDWMRVIVKQPSDYCALDIQPVVKRGWVRWWAADQGPLVWYHTRGC